MERVLDFKEIIGNYNRIINSNNDDLEYKKSAKKWKFDEKLFCLKNLQNYTNK